MVATFTDKIVQTTAANFDFYALDQSYEAGGPDFGWCYSAHDWANGPGGEVNYVDHVVSWGWNVKSPTMQAVADKPGFCHTIESKFYSADAFGNLKFASEWQTRTVTAAGDTVRHIEGFFPHDGVGNILGLRFGRVWFGQEGVSPDISVVNIRPHAASTAGGDGIFKITAPADHVSAARALNISFPAATAKDQVMAFLDGNTTFGVIAQMQNQGTGAVHLDLLAQQAGAAYIRISHPGTDDWSLGKAASGNFEIQKSGALATPANSMFKIDKTSFNLGIGMGSATPSGQLSVAQQSVTGAKPVLWLQQADVDQGFIEFRGTSDTNVTRALVDAADFPTPGAVAGYIMCRITDDAVSGSIPDGFYYLPFYAAPSA